MRVIILLLISVILISTNSFASINDNAGNSSAQFLKIQPSTRFTALGNVGTSFGGIIESLFYNPSGMGFLNRMEVNVNYSSWIENMKYSSAALGTPIENIGTIGIGFMGLFYGDIPIVTQDTSGELSSTDSTTANDMAFILSYGKIFGELFSIGVNTKMINQKMEEEKATSFGFDAGAMIKLLNKKLYIGFVIQNIGPKVKFIEKAYNLPMNIQIGTSYKMIDLIKHTGIIAIDISSPNDDNLKTNIGLEYGFYQFLYLRGGYQIGNNLNNLTAGGGIQVPLKNNIARIDYAYIPYSNFNITHMIGLIIGFGGE